MISIFLVGVIDCPDKEGGRVVTGRLLRIDFLAGLARRYAHKVLQALVRARLVRSQSGPRDGYAPVRSPEALSILDVVSAVEPIPRIRRCPLSLETHTSLCPLHQELDKVFASMEKAQLRVAIAHLLNQPDAAPPLCELEMAKR